MKEAMIAYVEGRWGEMRRPQGEGSHPIRNAPDEILEVVYQKLSE